MAQLIALLLLAAVITSSALAQDIVNITILHDAVNEGAVCLDGSPPAYYYRKGNSRNWFVFMQGGAWCYGSSDERSCLNRSETDLGSSTRMRKQFALNFGVFNTSRHGNPDFWNWNHVWINYCDGGSFSGEVANPVVVSASNKTRHLYYRGLRIWRYIMKDLSQKGMRHASRAVLSGCSAGGVAATLLCNEFRSLIPSKASVKCFSDGGFILDLKDIHGNYYLRSIFQSVVQEHGITIGLQRNYVPANASYQQLFPQYLLPFVKPPFFLLNSAYDTWQIRNVLSYPTAQWKPCVNDTASCTHTQLSILQGFRAKLLQSMRPALHRSRWGAFVDSCFHHCQGDVSAVRVCNQRILETLGNWSLDRKAVKLVDEKPWPSNPTCVTYFEDSWL